MLSFNVFDSLEIREVINDCWVWQQVTITVNMNQGSLQNSLPRGHANNNFENKSIHSQKIFLSVYKYLHKQDYYFSGYSDFSQTYYNNQYVRFSVFHIIRYCHYFVLHFYLVKLRVMYIYVQIIRSTIHCLFEGIQRGDVNHSIL